MNFNSQRVYRQPRVLLLALAAFIASVLSSLAVPVEAASGDLDPTFGIGGKVTVGILNTTFPTPPHAIAIQSDGKIVVREFKCLSLGRNQAERSESEEDSDQFFHSCGKICSASV